MKLYYSKGAASLAIRILINEIDIPCTYEAVDLKTKITESGNNYFEINAKGYVPALKLDNHVLTETAIILQYLADQYQAKMFFPEAGTSDRYHVLEWLNYIGTELHKNVAVIFNKHVPAETKDVLFNTGLKIKLNIVDNHLSGKSYLVGNHFTIADAYLFTILFWLPQFLKTELTQWPHLHRYYSKLVSRPSIQKAFSDEALEEALVI